MNKRIVSMIRKLSNTEQEISLTELAEEFQISQRTVRNDLNAINDLLTEQTLANIRLGKGGKILRQKDFPEILKSLDEKDFYDYKLSKEERKKIASVLLVTVSGYITLSEIAEHMAVSRATVINDLDEIKIYIHKGNLEVQSHPNKGLSVKGSESDRRVFLLGLVNYNPDAAREDIVQKQIAVNEEQNALIGKILSEQEHVHECFLSDSSFQKIQIYLEIMAKRLEQGCMIEPRRKKDNSKYAMAEDILKYVSQYCSVKINEDEVQFLSELLTFGRYMKQKHADPDSVKIQMITRGFIEKISDTLGTVLTQDYDFFENLSKHLESTITAGNMINEKNPVIENVVEENPEIYKAVKANLSMLEDYAGRALTDAETGYIVVHVCAAVERKKNQEISFRVIVACHAGIGTSRLLLERLKKHFNFRIVDIVSSHEAGNLKEDQGTVDAPVGRHPTDRKKIAVNYKNGKEAVTHYQVLERFGNATYIECRLETGRTHQIRVHMASLGHPLLGDTIYGSSKNPYHLQGQALHAMILGFVHPITREYLEFQAPLPEYFIKLLDKLRK